MFAVVVNAASRSGLGATAGVDPVMTIAFPRAPRCAGGPLMTD